MLAAALFGEARALTVQADSIAQAREILTTLSAGVFPTWWRRRRG